MENKMPKSKKRKKSSHGWSELDVSSVRLSSRSLLAEGETLTVSDLHFIHEVVLSDACNFVVEQGWVRSSMLGLARDGRRIFFVEGAPVSAVRVQRFDDLDVIHTCGSPFVDLDTVSAVVERLHLVALLAYGEASTARLEVGEASPNIGELSISQSYGEEVILQVVSPELGVHVTVTTPIVKTPFGRLASPLGAVTQCNVNIVADGITGELANCFPTPAAGTPSSEPF